MSVEREAPNGSLSNSKGCNTADGLSGVIHLFTPTPHIIFGPFVKRSVLIS
jgi:hypothetical protein